MTDINTELTNACDTIHAAARARPGETRAEAIARACTATAVQKKLVKAARTAAADMAAGRKISADLTDDDHLIPGDQQRNVTVGLLSEVLEAVAKGMRDCLADIVKDIAEIKEQQKDMLTDGDIWREEKLYRRGAQVTHDGTIWVAKEANSRARPGQSNNCWRMQVKTKGR